MPAAEGRTPECREGREPRAAEGRTPECREGREPGATEAVEVLDLPPRVDAIAAAALFRTWSPRAARLAAIDFAQVTAIDSAGVALVRALSAEAQRAGAAPPRLEHLPSRYRQLCLAHRIEGEGN